MKSIDLKKLLAPKQYDASSEKSLQDSIEVILLEEKIDFSREVILSQKDRVDFLVGAVGVEVKLQCPVTQVMRQVHRYTESPLIEEILIVTTYPKLSLLPRTFNGKPVHVLLLITTLL